MEKAADTPVENVVTIDEFRKTELRTAEVITAARVEGTNHLMQIEIALGDERRQIIAGIAGHYAPDDLVGKSIVVVANLKPAKIRGLKSDGMLLAASEGDSLRLLTTDGPLPSGSSVG